MKVLITATGSWGTGSFQVVNGIVGSLLASGHEVKVFFPDTGVDGPEVERFYSNAELYDIWRFPIKNQEAELKTFPLMFPDPNPRSPHAKTFAQLNDGERRLYFNDLKRRLSQVIESFQPDIIECQHIWAMDHIIGGLGHPFICVAHHSDQLGFKYDAGMQEITTESANKAQFIFAVSDMVRSEVVELYGVSPEKVITIPCGYNDVIFKPRQLDRKTVLQSFKLPIPPEARIISFAGKLSKTKGIDILLQANKFLSEDLNAHFIVMGAGDIGNALTGVDSEGCCFDRVHFIGHRSGEEVAAINNISDLAVVPSRSEGFCIAGLEAIACGLPLVISESARVGNYEVAESFPAEDAPAMAECITRLLGLSAKELAQYKKWAVESAKNFIWDRVTERRLHYYQLLVSRKDMAL